MEIEKVTSIDPKRLIYFCGHKNQNKSALITRVCRNYETISTLFAGELATRTLWNLYNLHDVRGQTQNGELILRTSMSGPHHYFGWIDPYKSHIIKQDSCGNLIYYQVHYMDTMSSLSLLSISNKYKFNIENFQWINGEFLDDYIKDQYCISNNNPRHLINTDSGQADSLFDNPGLLLIDEENITIPLIENPHLYDLSLYRASIVPNDQPFSFNQSLISQYEHAQHKLRVITYFYGDNYVNDYLMKDSGIFIERHEFIQAITPMNERCGGFVILGHINHDLCLELIAVPIRFGYTLLVDVLSIHGDSTLTGLYMMAMTGNHKAMKTADTVFIKNKQTYKNVNIKCSPFYVCSSILKEDILLTSDEKSLEELHNDNYKLEDTIYNSLNIFQKLWWRYVITTINGTNIAQIKTLGVNLPI